MQSGRESNAKQCRGSNDEATWRELQLWVAFDRWLYCTDLSGMTAEQIDAAMNARMEELGLAPP